MPGRGYKGKLYDYLFQADTKVVYSFLLAKGIYDNQPFATPRPAMQNALREGLPKLNKQIWAEAKKIKTIVSGKIFLFIYTYSILGCGRR